MQSYIVLSLACLCFMQYATARYQDIDIDDLDELQKREMPGVMRFGKRMLPNAIKFGKKDMPGVMRFGKRGMPGVMRFGKRTPDSIRDEYPMFYDMEEKRAMPTVMRFGKKSIPGVMRFGKRDEVGDVSGYKRDPPGPAPLRFG